MSDIVSYRISVPRPHTHLISVEMTVPDLSDRDEMTVRMPVWTPGSYKIREYSKQLQDLEARGENGPLVFEKIDKASWRIDTSGCGEATISYRVYGYQLSPRYNHVDDTHAFVNPVASCLYPEDRLDEGVRLEVQPPQQDWEVFCGLEAESGDPTTFVARDFDELFDSPVEMGPHQYFGFEVRGVEHRFVVWADDELDLEPLERDVPEIIEQNASMFEEIPYDRYVFINHCVPDQGGGLEHRHSSVNYFGPENLRDTERGEDGEYDEDYADLLRLLSHEHFHAYHVKRLRPEELGPFDYQRENYTRSLWAVEGVTSYFDTYQLLGAGLVGPSRYIDMLEDRIERFHRIPGRFVQSLEEASFDAWIKLYRSDENTPNCSVSYYLKGELVVWLLDLWIRDQTDGHRTMADAIRRLYNEYFVERNVGFPRGAVQDAVAAEADAPASDIFEVLVRRAAPVVWEDFLSPIGLTLRVDEDVDRPRLGIQMRNRSGGRRAIKFVERDSPAEDGGLYAGDEIIALDKKSVRGQDVDELLEAYEAGDRVVVDVVRRGRLRECEVELGAPRPDSFQLERIDDPSERQKQLLEGWLGATRWDE